jgi:hypothetical protein
VSAGAPILVSLCLALFLSSSEPSPGSYAELAKSAKNCALLEHRTQLCVLIVALGFCILQVWKGPLLSMVAAADEPSERGPGWPMTLTLILVFVFGFFFLHGELMTERVVDLYRDGNCSLGKVSALEFPPLWSPITWLRVIIIVVAFLSSFFRLHHYVKKNSF